MLEIVNIFGIWSSAILFTISILRLYKRPYYLGGYLVFFIINEIVNTCLKSLIKENRPKSELENASIFDNNEGADKYGMPSHHTQSLFFSLIYLYCVTNNVWIIMIELFIIGVTIYQRYNTKRHTLEQLAAGSLIGSMIGYISFISTKQYIYHRSAFYNNISL